MEEQNKKENANERWQRLNIRRYLLKVYKTTEADIIEKLESEPNKAGYIKNLIRQDLEKNKKG